MLTNTIVVQNGQEHTPFLRGGASMKKQQVLMKCAGQKKEPSKAAIDSFISIYLDLVKENQSKAKEG